VGIAILACGHLLHHALICFGSVAASLNPWDVSGFFPRALHGNTGKLCFAYQSAHSNIVIALNLFSV
jgi:hypothetical protein